MTPEWRPDSDPGRREEPREVACGSHHACRSSCGPQGRLGRSASAPPTGESQLASGPLLLPSCSSPREARHVGTTCTDRGEDRGGSRRVARHDSVKLSLEALGRRHHRPPVFPESQASRPASTGSPALDQGSHIDAIETSNEELRAGVRQLPATLAPIQQAIQELSFLLAEERGRSDPTPLHDTTTFTGPVDSDPDSQEDYKTTGARHGRGEWGWSTEVYRALGPHRTSISA